jgi:ubiquinone/menaquinone biosynthesis C-methylase UbiE
MQDGIRIRLKQLVAWGIFAVFIAGSIVSPLGAYTGPVLGIWFVGTQKPVRGFFWMLGLGFVTSLFWHGRGIWLAGSGHHLEAIGWLAAGTFFGTLPFLYHRLVNVRLPALWSTLPFPLAAAALPWAASTVIQRTNLLPQTSQPALANLFTAVTLREFLLLWLAAIVVWLWNRDFPGGKTGDRTQILAYCAAGVSAVFLLTLFPPGFSAEASILPALCAGACALLAVWVLFRSSGAPIPWISRADVVSLLRSPVSGAPLHVEVDHSAETLVSPTGERFPIRDGIPNFIQNKDLAGANGKYNHLYQTIGGFYDDSQRVVVALSAMDGVAYVMSYLGRLEIKPGDRVLETSVGTGLNFKFLPADIQRFGLDLSPAMLTRCQENLRRWTLPGDLFLGNAEALPFADESFDVVFHVGGINFFSNRALAIQEMIRVAKPGSLLLIADETEEHVQRAYENFPVTGEYFKDRTDSVAAPVDLVPAEMEDVRLETIGRNRFYALTFRKPQISLRKPPTLPW